MRRFIHCEKTRASPDLRQVPEERAKIDQSGDTFHIAEKKSLPKLLNLEVLLLDISFQDRTSLPIICFVT